MDIFELLKDDHRTVDRMLKEIEAATDPEERDEIFMEMKMELLAHAKAENDVVYNRFLADEDIKPIILEAQQEHALVEQLLDELDETKEQNEVWMAKFMVLKENIEHHVKEEESEMLPKVKDAIDKATAEKLAEEMGAAKEAYIS